MKAFFTTLLVFIIVSVVAQTHEPKDIKTARLLKLKEAGFDLESYRASFPKDEPQAVFDNMEKQDVEQMVVDPMVLIFNTNLSTGTTITLPLFGTVNVTVVWGDGSHSVITTQGYKQHTYAVEGVYTVSISGTLGQFGNGWTGYNNAEKLTKVTSFGNIGLTSLYGAFVAAINLTEVPGVLPGSVTNLSSMFEATTSFNQDIGGWNISNVTDITDMFYGASSFNRYIGGWNTGNVIYMSGVFSFATAFNQNIGGWNTSKVTDMAWMFDTATSFNQDIGGWDVSNVTNMWSMFSYATSFNKYIGGWNTGNVIDMAEFFNGASAFNQDIGDWDTGNVLYMDWMFQDASSFNQDLSGWCVTNIPSLPDLFDTGATSWTRSRPVWGTCPQDVSVPLNRSLSGITISNVVTDCFDAQQTITVSNFIVKSGGSATLIAGQNIILLPGTRIEAGGYFHAYITTENIYCMGPLVKSMVSEEVIVSVPEIPERTREDIFFKVYPNPTNGHFTLELENSDLENDTHIEVINLLGKRLFYDRLPPHNMHTLSLEGQQSGIYIIRVTKGNTVGTERIIKQ